MVPATFPWTQGRPHGTSENHMDPLAASWFKRRSQGRPHDTSKYLGTHERLHVTSDVTRDPSTTSWRQIFGPMSDLMIPATVPGTQERFLCNGNDSKDPRAALWYQRRAQGPRSGFMVSATFPGTKGRPHGTMQRHSQGPRDNLMVPTTITGTASWYQ